MARSPRAVESGLFVGVEPRDIVADRELLDDGDGLHAAGTSTLVALRPPTGVLRSQYPDLVLGAWQLLDCRQLRQAGRGESTRSFDTRSKASIDLAALAIKPGRRSLD